MTDDDDMNEWNLREEEKPLTAWSGSCCRRRDDGMGWRMGGKKVGRGRVVVVIWDEARKGNFEAARWPGFVQGAWPRCFCCLCCCCCYSGDVE